MLLRLRFDRGDHDIFDRANPAEALLISRGRVSMTIAVAPWPRAPPVSAFAGSLARHHHRFAPRGEGLEPGRCREAADDDWLV